MKLEEVIGSDLPPETFDEVYRTLLRGLRRKKGFGLFFVVQSDHTQGTHIIEQVRKDLPQKKIAVLEIDRKTQTLYDKIDELREKTLFDILFIRGIENALYEYEDTKRLSGWAEEETYAYSWKGVPPILSHLNQQRERFSQDFHCSFVFLTPSFAIDYFIQRAPDFFDWRSGVFHFPLTKEELQLRATKLLEDSFEECLKLTDEERVVKTLEIKSLIAENCNTCESNAKFLLKEGLLFFSGNKYEKALTSCDKALQIEPNNYLAWGNRGCVLLQLEQYEEAVASFDKVVEIKPDYHQIWDIRGKLLIALGRYNEALTSWEKLVNLTPNESEAWNIRGVTLLIVERYQEALESVDKAIALDSDQYYFWKNRGVILMIMEHYEEAVLSFDKAIDINPNEYNTWKDRGLTLGNLERYAEAVQSFENAITLKPDEYSLWVAHGIALGNLGKDAEAMSSFNKALLINCDDYNIWRNRGIALKNLGKYEEAIVSFDKAIGLNADEYSLWYDRGLSLGKLELYEESLVSFDRAIDLTSDDYNIWQNRGITLIRLERYEEALASFEQIIILKPDHYEAWDKKGFILNYLRRIPEAIASFNKAIDIEPRAISAYNTLGRIYYEQGDFELALKLLNRAIELNPQGDSLLWNNLGFLAIMQNKLKKAQSCLNRSLQIKANWFLPIFNLGLINVLKRQFKEAKRIIAKSLKCCDCDGDQEKLYFALGRIALGNKQEGLQNLQEIINALTHDSKIAIIRAGVLESAEILARYPSQFPGIDQALAMLQITLIKSSQTC
ncbi:MAG TPA: hypothetical protein DDZ80_08940 [Cyanobacteria bacterium UBA8803]|nr:hypothetical protein [Cyanobacteria bacterium UBA9273]HBL58624.1 hypothetical protein [Cyanobacteria bacterium UBA8803]